MNEIIETGPSKDECNIAMLAHLLGAVSAAKGKAYRYPIALRLVS